MRKFNRTYPLGKNFEKFIVGLLFVIVAGSFIKYCENKKEVKPKATPVFSHVEDTVSYPIDRYKKVALMLEQN